MAYITRELERKFLKLNDFFQGYPCYGRKAGRQNDDVKAPCRERQDLCHAGQYNGERARTV